MGFSCFGGLLQVKSDYKMINCNTFCIALSLLDLIKENKFQLITKNYMSYKSLREAQFLNIKQSVKSVSSFTNEDTIVALGDSLELLKLIPDNCISLVLTDPPYHSTKKENITNDTSFSSDESFLAWMESFFIQWKRILKPNGSIYMFCSSAMSSRLEICMGKYFNTLSHIVWTKPNDPGFDGWKGKMKKEALRQWYPHSERILFAEPAVEGNLNRSSFGYFLKSKRNEANLSGHQLTELIGAYGKVNHGGAVSNWETGRNIPSKDQYIRICEVFKEKGLENMPIYEDVIRPFEVNSSVEFTDVWNFYSVKPYKGKHPAEKPINMLEHCIVSTTFENDIVLDCFSGSGSTAIAALNLNRKAISFEIEPDWIDVIINRVEKFKKIPNNIDKNELMKKAIQNANVKNQTSLSI
jgi:adenine-specific DNA-methyltransferase